jgi:hypothetical protein
MLTSVLTCCSGKCVSHKQIARSSPMSPRTQQAVSQPMRALSTSDVRRHGTPVESIRGLIVSPVGSGASLRLESRRIAQ